MTLKCGQRRDKVRYSVLCISADTTWCTVPKKN